MRADTGFADTGLGELMFLCVCKAVRVSEAVAAAKAGINSPESLRDFFGFDDDECCGRCAVHIESVAARVQVELSKSDSILSPSLALGRA